MATINAGVHIKEEDIKYIEDSLKNILLWFDGFEAGRGKSISLDLKPLYLLREIFHETAYEKF